MTGDTRQGSGLAIVTPEQRAEAAAVGTASFVLSLRSRGVGDVRLLRAMELVPREVFAPRRFTDLARRDVALPLPCGQTMTAPGTVAGMLVALGVAPEHRVLEIGTGSGYVTALLGALAAEVVSIERFGTLVQSAREHLRIAAPPAPIRLENGDGLAARPRERFDRILVNGAVRGVPEALTGLLAPGGRLVGAVAAEDGPRLLRVERGAAGEAEAAGGPPIRLSPLLQGVARAL